jgi:stage II sporulation protein D
MEGYLRGVLPYEIGKLDESKFEALKAQAVAARTYAYKHFGSRHSHGFDIYADTRDQVYKGLQSATDITDKAVRETEGVVMTYDGQFITAYYHSTCGGQTEGVATWGRPDHPYLKSKPDLRPDGTPWCKESSYTEWVREFDEEELRDLFQINAKEAKANVPSFSSVKSMRILDTLKSGRIHTLEVVTNNGAFTCKADKIRWLFKRGSTILPSCFFRITKNGDKWIFNGKGFGHGVGLCQMGARARAQAGQSYIQILTHYYPGITLEKFTK